MSKTSTADEANVSAKTKTTPEPPKPMNIFAKLEKARLMFIQSGTKKSGHNKFAGFDYFELEDIVPAKTTIFNEIGLCDYITFTDEMATLTLIDVDDPDQWITFKSPMRNLELKGANAVQVLGGMETYQRRYLYMMVLDIVESDAFDVGQPTPPPPTPKSRGNDAFVASVNGIVDKLSMEEKTKAASIIKRLNGGKATYKEIVDPNTQNSVLKALKEEFHV